MNRHVFDFSYDRWSGWLLGLLGLGRRFSRLTVEGDVAGGVMGWAFRVDIPVSAIVSAGPGHDRVLSRGVHGWRGKWLVNGSSSGLVRLVIDPPAPSRVIGFRGRLRELEVSVADPDGFVAAVTVRA